MPRLFPLQRRRLIEKLRIAGFRGPFVATRHEYMLRGAEKIFIPNPHGKDIGVPILRKIVGQLGVSPKEFLDL